VAAGPPKSAPAVLAASAEEPAPASTGKGGGGGGGSKSSRALVLSDPRVIAATAAAAEASAEASKLAARAAAVATFWPKQHCPLLPGMEGATVVVNGAPTLVSYPPDRPEGMPFVGDVVRLVRSLALLGGRAPRGAIAWSGGKEAMRLARRARTALRCEKLGEVPRGGGTAAAAAAAVQRRVRAILGAGAGDDGAGRRSGRARVATALYAPPLWGEGAARPGGGPGGKRRGGGDSSDDEELLTCGDGLLEGEAAARASAAAARRDARKAGEKFQTVLPELRELPPPAANGDLPEEEAKWLCAPVLRAGSCGGAVASTSGGEDEGDSFFFVPAPLPFDPLDPFCGADVSSITKSKAPEGGRGGVGTGGDETMTEKVKGAVAAVAAFTRAVASGKAEARGAESKDDPLLSTLTFPPPLPEQQQQQQKEKAGSSKRRSSRAAVTLAAATASEPAPPTPTPLAPLPLLAAAAFGLGTMGRPVADTWTDGEVAAFEREMEGSGRLCLVTGLLEGGGGGGGAGREGGGAAAGGGRSDGGAAAAASGAATGAASVTAASVAAVTAAAAAGAAVGAEATMEVDGGAATAAAVAATEAAPTTTTTTAAAAAAESLRSCSPSKKPQQVVLRPPVDCVNFYYNVWKTSAIPRVAEWHARVKSEKEAVLAAAASAAAAAAAATSARAAAQADAARKKRIREMVAWAREAARDPLGALAVGSGGLSDRAAAARVARYRRALRAVADANVDEKRAGGSPGAVAAPVKGGQGGGVAVVAATAVKG
jgi:hypothetical protein